MLLEIAIVSTPSLPFLFEIFIEFFFRRSCEGRNGKSQSQKEYCMFHRNSFFKIRGSILVRKFLVINRLRRQFLDDSTNTVRYRVIPTC